VVRGAAASRVITLADEPPVALRRHMREPHDPPTLDHATVADKRIAGCLFSIVGIVIAAHICLTSLMLMASALFIHRSQYGLPANSGLDALTRLAIAWRRSNVTFLTAWVLVNATGLWSVVLMGRRSPAESKALTVHWVLAGVVIVCELVTYGVLAARAQILLYIPPDMTRLQSLSFEWWAASWWVTALLSVPVWLVAGVRCLSARVAAGRDSAGDG
jgi:hypothetical protein